MSDPQWQPPATDQIEVSLFGPGFGESILVHLGNNEWLAVDSCVDGGRVAQLDYLDRLGVDIATAVRMQVVSHWHDDHVAGLSRFYERATGAILYFAAALTTKEFLTYADLLASDDPNPYARETKEIVQTLDRAIGDVRQRETVVADRLIYRSDATEIFALSPHSTEYERFLSTIRDLVPSAGRPQSRRRIGALRPNAAAIALQVSTPAGVILLGSDLEEHRVRGWSTMISASRALKQNNIVFKVPHHGSQNAHCDDLWSLYRADDCIAIVTPFVRGGVTLPTPADVSRITGLSTESYITARPQGPAVSRRSNEVERALRRDAVRLRRAMPRMGHIRLRSSLDQHGVWSVELFGEAIALSTIAA